VGKLCAACIWKRVASAATSGSNQDFMAEERRRKPVAGQDRPAWGSGAGPPGTPVGREVSAHGFAWRETFGARPVIVRA
jgi:hypothetical protein